MAQDLYESLSEAKEIYDNANDILGFDLAKISFHGPEEELKQTRITQPAIFVHSVILTQILLKKEFAPDMVAGHSLGEYSALYAAQSLSLEDALALVKIRAELMQQAGEIKKGTMAAIIGLKTDVVKSVCDEASTIGIVQVANYNSPAQVVISGSVAGVTRAMELSKEKGAKRVIPLVVSGAFHSPLMEYAESGLKKALDEIDIKTARIPVYSNVHAKPVTEPEEIKRNLTEQLTSPVRWLEIIENMIQDGATEFYEIGPGNVLKGLLKRINREVEGKSIDTIESLEKC